MDAARRSGKTALQWLWLRARAREVDRPIECITCERVYVTPPHLGCCVCGSYLFGVRLATVAQPALDFHAGEQ